MSMLLKDNKEIMKYWNYSKNKNIDLNSAMPKSGLKAWWICEKGHEWEATISHVSNGTRCPYCSGQKILKGFNDIATTNPEVIKEWNYKKNDILPVEISKGSSRKVWWTCEKGHDYLMSVSNKINKKHICPICANRIVLKGYNDLEFIFPQLAKEWNYEKNGDLIPSEVLSGSNKKVWWKCNKCGYEWIAPISSRTITGNKCKKCAINSVGGKIIAKKVLKNGNLLQMFPKLSKEWNYKRNGTLKPEQFHPGSTQKVWWKCPRGHEYEQIIYERTKDNYNCPICANESHSSFPEQVIYYYCQKYFRKHEVINRYKIEKKEADIFIKKLNIAIEYDGFYYHDNNDTKATEKRKNEYFKNNNIKLIRVKENAKSDKYSDSSYDIISIVKDPKYADLNNMVERLLTRISNIKNMQKKYNIDVEKDRMKIMSCYIFNIKKNSLAEKKPEIAKQWNYEKNGDLTPEMFSYCSTKRVWWRCEKGHEWEDSINNRTNGSHCVICSNRRVSYGINDLYTKYPNLLKEWDYKKNDGLDPKDIVYASTKKVWWKCEKGHSFNAQINSRTKNNYSCPYCNNSKLLCGYNDLKTMYPELSKEWNYKKNSKKPEDVLFNENKKYWWKCKTCGKEWETNLNYRIKGIGCPKCGIKKQAKSFIDNKIAKKGSLMDNKPYLAEEWNYEKNGDLKPNNVLCGSNKKVWWKCKKGHEWEATISKRTGGTGCPYCYKNSKK